MNRTPTLLLVLGGLVVGLVVGYALGRQQKRTGGFGTVTTPPASENVVEVFRKAARQAKTARQDCFKEKLGAERYAALVLNPSAATPEDQFNILPCQNL